MRTVEEAKQWAEQNKASCMESYKGCKEIPDCMRSEKLEQIWLAGCWMNYMLLSAGASQLHATEIGFVHGQKSFYLDTWKIAVSCVNEFEQNRHIADKPGEQLAMELHETYGKKGE